jgi:hypothetical protein
LERTWKNSILPLLEEYFYSAETDVASEFGLGALRAGLTREPEPSDEEEDESQES